MPSPDVFVHDHALCESDDIGAGTRVWAFAHILAGASVGQRCNICDHVFIEGGAIVGDNVTVKNNVLIWDRVTIEDDVFLGPNAVFTNDPNPRSAFKKPADQMVATVVRRGATIGGNATVVCGIEVGEQAFVGAGAVVTRDVPAHALVYGNPAKQAGWICTCGEKLGDALECEACGRAYAAGDGGLTERS